MYSHRHHRAPKYFHQPNRKHHAHSAVTWHSPLFPSLPTANWLSVSMELIILDILHIWNNTWLFVACFCHFGITHNSNDWNWRNTEEVCDSTSPTNLPGVLQNPFASHNKVKKCLFEPHFTAWELWHKNMIVCLSQADFEFRSLRKQLPDTHYHEVSEISL